MYPTPLTAATLTLDNVDPLALMEDLAQSYFYLMDFYTKEAESSIQLSMHGQL
jgi:hypothetical protein